MDRLLRKIWIQQDGAKTHISADDNEFMEALNAQEINVELYTQAVNSPDVNLLNLGFSKVFRVSMMRCLKMKKNQFNLFMMHTLITHEKG